MHWWLEPGSDVVAGDNVLDKVEVISVLPYSDVVPAFPVGSDGDVIIVIS